MRAWRTQHRAQTSSREHGKKRSAGRRSPRGRGTSTHSCPGKGYVKLGEISLTEDSQECENNQCTPVAHDENLEMRVRREAAGRGGDLVRLERENVSDSTTRYKEGECIATGERTVYITERKCSRYSSTGTCANWVDTRTPDGDREGVHQPGPDCDDDPHPHHFRHGVAP